MVSPIQARGDIHSAATTPTTHWMIITLANSWSVYFLQFVFVVLEQHDGALLQFGVHWRCADAYGLHATQPFEVSAPQAHSPRPVFVQDWKAPAATALPTSCGRDYPIHARVKVRCLPGTTRLRQHHKGASNRTLEPLSVGLGPVLIRTRSHKWKPRRCLGVAQQHKHARRHHHEQSGTFGQGD